MLLSLVLTGLLTAAAHTDEGQVATTAQRTPPGRDAAVELAQNGKNAEALAAFRRIAAANPRDRDARMWIGRLHLRMGHPDLAEPVYRTVMLEDRKNVAARLGLADALLRLRRTDDAIDVLDEAEQTEPENPEVLAALGRAHRAAGNTTLSIGYLERAVMMSPTMDHRISLEQSRAVFNHRIASTSFVEDFNLPVADTRNTDLTANVRITDRLRLLGRGQYQRKFGITDQRGGLGVEWRHSARTTLFTHALVGPGNDVLPRADVNAAVGHVSGATEWTLGYRFIGFSVANVSVISPGVTWWATDKLSLGLRYHASVTDIDAEEENVMNHSATLRGSYLVYPRVWLSAGYARGVENFDTLSPDRAANFHANTASGAVQVDLPSMTSLVGQYEHQRRPGDVRMGRFTLAIVQRF